jgi:hypothetical protein
MGETIWLTALKIRLDDTDAILDSIFAFGQILLGPIVQARHVEAPVHAGVDDDFP